MTNGTLIFFKYREKLFIKLKKMNSGSEFYECISSNLNSYNYILKQDWHWNAEKPSATLDP